jgi:hypothetical protein
LRTIEDRERGRTELSTGRPAFAVSRFHALKYTMFERLLGDECGNRRGGAVVILTDGSGDSCKCGTQAVMDQVGDHWIFLVMINASMMKMTELKKNVQWKDFPSPVYLLFPFLPSHALHPQYQQVNALRNNKQSKTRAC